MWLQDKTSDFAPVSRQEFLDIQATIECRFTLNRVRDMTRTYGQRYQPRTKYLRKTLVFMELAYYGKGSISVFKESFANIDKIFFLGRRLGTRV